ncbi:MAG: hypothetical protein ACKVPX_10075 [Myxococcaceae bacterium]
MARTAAARNRRSKAEVQEEFDRLAENIAESKQNLGPKDAELARLKEAETRQSVEGVSVESVVQQISHLNFDITKAIADVSAKLTSEVERLTQVREAVALEKKELERLHQIDVAATSLDHLVEEFRAKQAELESEISTRRSTWLEERQAHDRDQREAEEALKKQRQRETEDYEYKKALERKKNQDKYDEEMRLLEKTNQEKREALEKAWQDREAALKAAEDELARCRLDVAAFPARLKEERDRAVAEASATLRQSAEQQILLLKKDMESEKRVSELRIHSLEEANVALAGQRELLSRQLEEAKKQVQDIALKAIEGASGANALAHINKIAMEQAKTRMGQG